jgi:SAM-dependent methyltransferase
MPRPAGMSRLHYYSAAAVGRATALLPVARLREAVIAMRAPEPADPAPGGIPLPPARLRVLVDGHGDPDGFLRGGAENAEMIRGIVGDAGVDFGSLDAILDFGCGCGRVARHWGGLEGTEVHACDYNPRLVDWCRRNLPFVQARTNELEPPTSYPDAHFDLVYAISILTHLTEPLARRWLEEWRRILRPGALLLFSTHGDSYRESLGTRQRERYDAGEMIVVGARIEGTNACAAHHPYEFVTNRLLDGFELLSFSPHAGPPGFRQDVYLARRR